MKLNIKSFLIIINIILQTVGYFQKSWGTTIKNCAQLKDHHIIKNNFSYLKEIKISQNSNYKTYSLNYMNNLNYDNIMKCSYENKFSLPLFHKSRVFLQNDSVNITHIFYNDQNKYHKILPFFQLGLQSILSNKIVSIGGGNRYAYNNACAIGYNTFYHFPISSKKNNNQPYAMNISGEFWYHNMLFMLNSFYKIDNFSYLKKRSFQQNIQYPKIGYQIHIQTQFPMFSNVTGKVTLENFFYKKIKNNINKNYHLILGMDYYPIPMLGFNINKIFVHKKNNNTIYKILINYQLNTPIAQQIYNVNNNKNSSIFTHINTIVQPFFPIVITNTDNVKYDNKNPNYCEGSILKCCYKEIIGRPGEIKIIDIHIDDDDNNHQYDDESIQWDIQSLKTLKNCGGNIVLLQKFIYAVHIPNKLMNEENKFTLSYVIMKKASTDNLHISLNKNKKYQLLISIQDFQKNNEIPQNLSVSCDDFNNSIIKQNFHESTTSNAIENQQIYCSSTLNKDHCFYDDESKNNISSIISTIPPMNAYDDSINYDTTIIKNPSAKMSHCSDYDTLPFPPPSLIFSSSFENITAIQNTIDKENHTKNFSYEESTALLPPIPPPLPSSPPPFLLKNTTPPPASSSRLVIKKHKSSDNITPSNIINFNKNTNFTTTSQQDLLHALSIHKKSNFSLIGTTAHINKLENISIHRTQKYLSDIEKIFSKLRITQSTSSIDESYTTDDSNDENLH